MSAELPGTLRVVMPDGQIKETKLETYLAGVVYAELGSKAPLEAMKAQAVASRTYAVAAHRHPELDADVCTTAHCQEWKRVDPIVAPEVFRAVSETWGVVALHDGKLIDAFFFEHCDGHTRSAQDLLMPDVPYLQSVECPCGFVARQGHGVGLCQRGAIVLARRRMTFEDILKYYYHNIVIVHTALDREKEKTEGRRSKRSRDPALSSGTEGSQPSAVDSKQPKEQVGRKHKVEPRRSKKNPRSPGRGGGGRKRAVSSGTEGSEQSTVSSEQSTVSSEQSTVSSEQSTVTSEQSTVNSKQLTVDSELGPGPSALTVDREQPPAPSSAPTVEPVTTEQPPVDSGHIAGSVIIEPVETESVDSSEQEPVSEIKPVLESAPSTTDAQPAAKESKQTTEVEKVEESPVEPASERQPIAAEIMVEPLDITASEIEFPVEPEEVELIEPEASTTDEGFPDMMQIAAQATEFAALLLKTTEEELADSEQLTVHSEQQTADSEQLTVNSPAGGRGVFDEQEAEGSEGPVDEGVEPAAPASQEPSQAGEPPASPAAKAPYAPAVIETRIPVPSYIEQLNRAASLTADEISSASPLSASAEPQTSAMPQTPAQPQTPAAPPQMPPAAAQPPILAERVFAKPRRTHIDQLPGPRMIAGCVSSTGVAISVEDARGNKLLVFSGNAPHYGPGGFETIVDEDGRYIVCIDDQPIEVDVRGGTAFILVS